MNVLDSPGIRRELLDKLHLQQREHFRSEYLGVSMNDERSTMNDQRVSGVAQRIVSLPMGPYVREVDQVRVVEAVRGALA